MIIIIHILSATGSLIVTGLALLSPSTAKLKLAYALVALGITSGFILVVTKPANLASVCIGGLGYLAAVTVGIVFARRRLRNRYSA
jgi:hypothetical protein